LKLRLDEVMKLLNLVYFLFSGPPCMPRVDETMSSQRSTSVFFNIEEIWSTSHETFVVLGDIVFLVHKRVTCILPLIN